MNNIEEKIKSLWENNKLLFLLLLPILALVMFRNVLIDILVSSGNKKVGEATLASDQLKQEATVANTQADQIIKDADHADATKPTADENWNTKK